MGFIRGVLTLFGLGSKGEKSIVDTVAEVVDNHKPGIVTQHKMDVEQTKVEDASQDSARKYDTPSSDDLFNRIINGLNRLPRPLFALWAFGQLAGVLPVPTALLIAPPIVLNIIWTVIGFYFGIRTISSDLPHLIKAIRG